MKRQNVRVYLNEQHKLFYVGLYNTDAHNQHIEAHYSRARWAYNNAKKNICRSLYSGFHIALVNTGFDGWREVECALDRCLEDAYIDRREYIEKYELKGYECVKIDIELPKHNDPGHGISAKMWNTRFRPENMTFGRIKKKVMSISKSLPEANNAIIVNASYYAIIDPYRRGPASYGDDDYVVDNMGALLKFVRNRLGKE